MSKKLQVYGELEEWSKFKITARHPLADQAVLLKKLNRTPDTCTICDIWWDLDDVLVLVCFASGEIGKTTFNPASASHSASFYVRTRAFPLTTAACNLALEKISNWFCENQSLVLSKSREVISVFEYDICLKVE